LGKLTMKYTQNHVLSCCPRMVTIHPSFHEPYEAQAFLLQPLPPSQDFIG
jgi:hypothetical protein